MVKGTRGKQLVKSFFCPKCQEESGEQQIGKDMDCIKGQYKVVSLCYKCGFTQTLIKYGKIE